MSDQESTTRVEITFVYHVPDALARALVPDGAEGSRGVGVQDWSQLVPLMAQPVVRAIARRGSSPHPT
jgi:hypothetical protein